MRTRTTSVLLLMVALCLPGSAFGAPPRRPSEATTPRSPIQLVLFTCVDATIPGAQSSYIAGDLVIRNGGSVPLTRVRIDITFVDGTGRAILNTPQQMLTRLGPREEYRTRFVVHNPLFAHLRGVAVVRHDRVFKTAAALTKAKPEERVLVARFEASPTAAGSMEGGAYTRYQVVSPAVVIPRYQAPASTTLPAYSNPTPYSTTVPSYEHGGWGPSVTTSSYPELKTYGQPSISTSPPGY